MKHVAITLRLTPDQYEKWRRLHPERGLSNFILAAAEEKYFGIPAPLLDTQLLAVALEQNMHLAPRRRTR